MNKTDNKWNFRKWKLTETDFFQLHSCDYTVSISVPVFVYFSVAVSGSVNWNHIACSSSLNVILNDIIWQVDISHPMHSTLLITVYLNRFSLSRHKRGDLLYLKSWLKSAYFLPLWLGLCRLFIIVEQLDLHWDSRVCSTPISIANSVTISSVVERAFYRLFAKGREFCMLNWSSVLRPLGRPVNFRQIHGIRKLQMRYNSDICLTTMTSIGLLIGDDFKHSETTKSYQLKLFEWYYRKTSLIETLFENVCFLRLV